MRSYRHRNRRPKLGYLLTTSKNFARTLRRSKKKARSNFKTSVCKFQRRGKTSLSSEITQHTICRQASPNVQTTLDLYQNHPRSGQRAYSIHGRITSYSEKTVVLMLVVQASRCLSTGNRPCSITRKCLQGFLPSFTGRMFDVSVS